jgi:hypothetical protein
MSKVYWKPDSQPKPRCLSGTFPGYIIKGEKGELRKTREDFPESIPYTYWFVFDDTSELKGKTHDGEEHTCEHMTGTRIRLQQQVWFSPEPNGQDFLNNRYGQFHNDMGWTWEAEDVEGVELPVLEELEGNELEGTPVMITVASEAVERNGSSRIYYNAVKVTYDPDREPLKEEEVEEIQETLFNSEDGKPETTEF